MINNKFIIKMNELNDLIEQMKSNSQSVFHRIPFNLSISMIESIEKNDNDDIIEIKREKNYRSIDIIEKGEYFSNSCIEACKICKRDILRFKACVYVMRFWAIFISGMVSISSEYDIPLYIALSVTFFGSLMVALDSLADWSKLIEKYSMIMKKFYDLSTSKDENRKFLFKKLVNKYNDNLLFVDCKCKF